MTTLLIQDIPWIAYLEPVAEGGHLYDVSLQGWLVDIQAVVQQDAELHTTQHDKHDTAT
jgi:hypothetical protein